MATKKFTVKDIRNLYAKLVRVANDQLDIAAAQPAPEEGAGTAGPQEVVDALEVVIDELEAVSEAIPAEPTNAEPEAEAEVEEPVEEPVEEVPEEEPKLAKRVRQLEAQLAEQEREKVATQFAELFEGQKIQQAKYDEVLNSKDSLSIWTAKIESIEQYKQNEGATSPYKPAKTTTSWVQPRSKFAKQDNGMLNL